MQIFPCENYDGATYMSDPDGKLPFATPDGRVALNTVTYIRGVGMSSRVVAIPGSHPDAWQREVQDYDVCGCSPPAVWHFIGIDGDRVVTYNTLDVHAAVHLMCHPDHLFEQNPQLEGGLVSRLRLVPESDGLYMVMTEMTDYLADKGVPGMREDNELSYDEIKDFDVDELMSQIFGENE